MKININQVEKGLKKVAAVIGFVVAIIKVFK